MFATAILTLNANEFQGGLFLTNFSEGRGRGRGRGSGSGSIPHEYGGGEKIFLPLRDGDIVTHQHDLLHGVDVQGNGERVSLIFWFRPPGLCSSRCVSHATRHTSFTL
jgi:hypothetical protein